MPLLQVQVAMTNRVCHDHMTHGLVTHISTLFPCPHSTPQVPAGADLPVKPSDRAGPEVAALLRTCRMHMVRG